MLEAGILAQEAGRYVLTGPLPPFAIPTTLQDSLMARLDRLAPVREVAQIGAVIGRTFSQELLAEVAANPDTLEALSQLTDAQLVFRRGVPPEATYTFKHALVQEAAYKSAEEPAPGTARAYRAGAPEAAPGQSRDTAGTARASLHGSGIDGSGNRLLARRRRAPRASDRQTSRQSLTLAKP